MLQPSRVFAGGSTAPGAEIGAAKHRFHQCLGLLKKHPSKTPPAEPVSSTICTSKSATKSTSIYTTICATTSRITGPAVLCSNRQNPVLRPVPGIKIPECAEAVKGWPHQRPPRSGAEPRTAGPSPASMANVLPACVPADLDKVRTRKSKNPLTNIVRDGAPTLKNPLAGQYRL